MEPDDGVSLCCPSCEQEVDYETMETDGDSYENSYITCPHCSDRTPSSEWFS